MARIIKPQDQPGDLLFADKELTGEPVMLTPSGKLPSRIEKLSDKEQSKAGRTPIDKSELKGD